MTQWNFDLFFAVLIFSMVVGGLAAFPVLFLYRVESRPLSRRGTAVIAALISALATIISALVFVSGGFFETWGLSGRRVVVRPVRSAEATIAEMIEGADNAFNDHDYRLAQHEYDRSLRAIDAVTEEYAEDRERYRVVKSEVQVKADLARIATTQHLGRRHDRADNVVPMIR